MVIHETLSRIRCLQHSGRPPAEHPESRTFAARSRMQKEGRCQPAKAGAETESQAFRFPRLCRLASERVNVRLSLLHLAGEFGVGEPLANDLRYRRAEALRIGSVTLVKAKCLFIQIPEQVERFHADVGSVQATLQQRPKLLKSVRVDFAANLFYRVVNRFMLELTHTFVGLQRVRKDRRSHNNVFADLVLKGLLLGVVYNLGVDLAAALQDPHDGGLILAAGAGDLRGPLALVHIPCLAADVGFVRFDLAGQFAAGLTLQAQADAVHHMPRALLSDSQRAVDLPRGNAVLHTGLHPDRYKPLVQTERRVFHDGSDLRAELGLRMPRLALPHATRCNKANIRRSASRADNAIRPATRNQIADAIVGIREIDYGIPKCLWFAMYFAHTSTSTEKA